MTPGEVDALQKVQTFEDLIRYISRITNGALTLEHGLKRLCNVRTYFLFCCFKPVLLYVQSERMNLTFFLTCCCCSLSRLTVNENPKLLVFLLGLCSKRHDDQDPCDDKSRSFWDPLAENATADAVKAGTGSAIQNGSSVVAVLTANSVLSVECFPTFNYNGKNNRSDVHCMGFGHVNADVQNSAALVLHALLRIAIQITGAEVCSILSFGGGTLGSKIAKAVKHRPIVGRPIVGGGGTSVTVVATETCGHQGYARRCGTGDLRTLVQKTLKVLNLDATDPEDDNGNIRAFMDILYMRYEGGSKETRTKIMLSFEEHELDRFLENPRDIGEGRAFLDVVPEKLRGLSFTKIMDYVLTVRALFSFGEDVVVVVVFPNDLLTLSWFVSVLFHLCNSTLIFQHEDLVVRRVVWQPWLPKDTMR